MLVRDSDGIYESIGESRDSSFGGTSLITLDFRETAPAAASEDMYENNIMGSVRGGLASGVPGDLRGLEYLHKKYGVSPMFCLFTESS